MSTPAFADISISVNLFWDGNRPYYVDTYYHRRYVTIYEAQDYYYRRDPRWFQAHEREWHSDHAGFDRDWQHEHYRDQENHDRHDHDNHDHHGDNR